MPVYQVFCPACGHRFSGMVFAGTREPEHWICSQCGSNKAQPVPGEAPVPHPLEAAHGAGCPCCGGGNHPPDDDVSPCRGELVRLGTTAGTGRTSSPLQNSRDGDVHGSR